MELYQTYLRDLLEIHKVIGDHLSELNKSVDTGNPNYVAPATSGPTSRAARIAAVLDLIQQGKTCLYNMEMESNDVIPAERITIRAEIVDHRKRLNKYDIDITAMKAKVAKAERDDLLKGGKRIIEDPNLGIPDDLDEASKKERAAMAAVTAKQQGNTDIMRNIERMAAQGATTIQETEKALYKQREDLTNIHDKTRELDAEVSDARRLANQMHKVMVQNKAVLLGIIALLVIMIIVIIYVKAVGSGTTTTTTIIVTLAPSAGGDGGDGGLSE